MWNELTVWTLPFLRKLVSTFASMLTGRNWDRAVRIEAGCSG
jgi:hypothetical protein